MDPRPPLPERFQLRLDGGLELSWKWKRYPLTTLLFFLCCCPGTCVGYGEGLISGTVQITENGKFVRHAHIPWLGYLLIAGAILTAAVLLYTLLVNRLNRTTLRAGNERLSLRHRPLPLPGIELHASDIVRFEGRLSRKAQRMIEFSQQRPESSRRRYSPQDFKGEYEVYAIDRQGKRHRLLSELDTKEQGAWLARELRRALGMRLPEEEGP
jgi:hypothetical protein